MSSLVITGIVIIVVGLIAAGLFLGFGIVPDLPINW